MADRPLIFVGKMPNRDQSYTIQDMLELKDPKDHNKGVKGMGQAFKYMWENLILEVKNVMTSDGEKESIKDSDKDALWYAEGMEQEQNEAITHFYTKGKLTDEEAKTLV